MSTKSTSLALKNPGETLILVGESRGHLGCSLYLRELLGREDGAPPPVDLPAERKTGDFVRGEILAGRVSACHDLSDGGLLVALAEMAMAGGIGAAIAAPAGLPTHAAFFGEDQGRYLLATDAPDRVLARAAAAFVPAAILGTTGGDALTVAGSDAISVAELKRVNEAWLPSYMEG